MKNSNYYVDMSLPQFYGIPHNARGTNIAQRGWHGQGCRAQVCLGANSKGSGE